jgi:hypothetical protein
MKIAVITGASSGLGMEFANTIIKKYNTLNEIWIIARREERLHELADQYGKIKVRALPMDLADDMSYPNLEKLLDKEKPEVQMLINNAGYERSGKFEEMSMRDISGMINLNVKGMTAVNRLFLPYMDTGSFCILTCSVSSFVPIPNQAVYSATKAYMYYLGKALREEMSARGINVLLLCPGNMDTEMNPKNKMRQSGKINRLPFLDMKLIAEQSLIKAQKGVAVYTPGKLYKFYRIAGKIFPSALMLKIAKSFY